MTRFGRDCTSHYYSTGNNIKYDKQMGGEAPHDNADIFLYPKPYGFINYGYVPQPGSSAPIHYNLHEGSSRLAQRIPIYLLSENNY
jgi:hypothetical protein